MSQQTIKLIDGMRNIVAVAHVAEEGDHHAGTMDARRLPDSVRSVFEEFEEIVNGQMFSFLDDMQAKINSLAIKAVLSDGCEVRIEDLQFFPSTGEVSFKIAPVAVPVA